MNTRILRMCRRTNVGNLRHVEGLGQLQPVQFYVRDGQVMLAIEGMYGDRWCWWKLPLPKCKAQAKTLFAELERCKALGIKSPANAAWEKYQQSRRTA